MANKRNNIIHSPDFIRRYVEGDLSDEENHRIERAALEDPFLADAIEGMRMAFSQIGTQKFDEDVRELSQNVQGHSRKRSVMVWWKAAAIIIVVISGIALTFFMQKEDLSETAIVMQESVSEGQPRMDTAARSSATDAAAALPEIEKSESNSEIRAVSPQKLKQPRRENKALPGSAPNDAEQHDETSKHVASASANEGIMEPAATQGAETLKAEDRSASLETESRPRAVADIEARKTKDERSPPSANGHDVAAATEIKQQDTGVEKFNQTLSGRAAGVVVQQENAEMANQAELFDVVVTGFSPIRNNQARMRQNTTSKRFAPENGWPAFHQYVQQNKRLTSDAESDQISEVTFSLDSIGRPTDIRITQSISRQHDLEVKRLLMEGPSWKILKGRPRRLLLRVQF